MADLEKKNGLITKVTNEKKGRICYELEFVHQNKHIRIPFAAIVNYTHLTYLMLWSNTAAK